MKVLAAAALAVLCVLGVAWSIDYLRRTDHAEDAAGLPNLDYCCHMRAKKAAAGRIITSSDYCVGEAVPRDTPRRHIETQPEL